MSSSGSSSVTIPSGACAGSTYYIVGKADNANAVSEVNENNNTKATSISIGTGSTSVDLYVMSLSALIAGSNIDITDTTGKNACPAVSTTTRFYLSPDNTAYTPGNDTYLGERTVSAFTATYHQNETALTSVPIPVVTPGTYYVIGKADAGTSVTETNEANNNKLTSIVIP
jgi:subtilase family serine protease